MKTTIELPDALFRQAKRHAQEHHVTLKTLVEQGLRKVLAEQKEAKPFKLRDGSFDGGSGVSPELKTWDQIRDILYDPTTGRG